ncbi:carbohydrate ABC transporter substrate-binding protein [Cellulomonas hominis]|nr:carbohydrate ABC transporter substrate-binding protein [Cellulomonas hominis]
MSVRTKRRACATAGAGLAIALALVACSGGGGDGGGGGEGDGDTVTLTWFMGAGVPDDIATAEQLAEDFNAQNPGIEVVVDASGPEGSELDNMVKTRLSTGDMSDLFWYNSGALMLALNPDQQLLNVGDEPWLDDLNAAYRGTISTDAGAYGAPVGSAMGGGFFYNIKVYEDLGLTAPTTWDEFMENNAAIRAAGIDPVIQSYGDTWTSQMVTLADFYNVYEADPDFGEQLTANEVTFADTPAALASFQKLEDLATAGYFNEDYPTLLLDQALAKLANGEGAAYPMLTFAQATITQNFPDQAEDIGFFPVPGDSADANGLTTWMPSSVYAPAYTEHPDEVKKFMAFVASPDGCDAITTARGVTGPYVVDGCEITGDVSRIVQDMLPFFEDDRTAPALEFLSPVKGPNLLNITVELGSGITTAEQAAKAYDADNAAQAQQLGLEGW